MLIMQRGIWGLRAAAVAGLLVGSCTQEGVELYTATDQPICSNGRIDPGEACDDGNPLNGDRCTGPCVLRACGNGHINPGEQCDDGNNTSGDGCSAGCQLELCGNGILDLAAGEQCDDLNRVSGDGCSADCQLEL